MVTLTRLLYFLVLVGFGGPATSTQDVTQYIEARHVEARANGWTCDGTLDGNTGLHVAEVLRYAIHKTQLPDSTTYKSGENVACIPKDIDISLGPDFGHFSLSINLPLAKGGICIFPEDNESPITLKEIKPLVDYLITKGCETCGKVAIHLPDRGTTDYKKWGVLKIDYKEKDDCIKSCVGLNEDKPSSLTTSTTQPFKTTQTAKTTQTVKITRVTSSKETSTASQKTVSSFALEPTLKTSKLTMTIKESQAETIPSLSELDTTATTTPGIYVAAGTSGPQVSEVAQNTVTALSSTANSGLCTIYSFSYFSCSFAAIYGLMNVAV